MIDSTPITPIQDLPPFSSSHNNYWNIAIHSVITFLGQSLMQVVDLLFCRDLGSTASATVGTSTSLFTWFMIVGLGLVSSLEYFIPHSIGSNDEKKAHAYFHTGLWVGVAVSLFSAFGIIAMVQGLDLFGVNPALRSSVQMFCYIISASYLPIFLVPVLRVELQSRGHPHDTTYAFIFANLLNIFLNWVLVLGHLGMPALGLEGSAWANLLSRYGLLIYLGFRTFGVRARLSHLITVSEIEYLKYAKKIVAMGAPISFHLLFEMGAFALVGTLAARLSSVQNAAHSITISIASFVFMIPLGLGSAAALTMSKANGENHPTLALYLGKKTIRLGLIYALAGSIVIVLFRTQLIELYTSDPATIALGANLLMITAFFQFGDAMQVILAGCIRGFGETKIQAKINAVGHWVIGIPLGVLLGFHFGYQITGLWIGLCAGLFSVALGLLISWRKMVRTLAY
jgi:MATE family multidrug resistance protein